MLAPSSGSRTPARMPRTAASSSVRGALPSGYRSGGRGRRRLVRLDRRVTAIKHASTLKICPIRGYRQADMNALAVLQALGDETRYLLYRELGGLATTPRRTPARRPSRPPREHRSHAPRAHARGRSRRGRAGAPRHRRAARSTSTPSPAAPRGSISTLRRTPCWPACSPRWPSASVATRTDAEETGRAWGKEAARRTRSGQLRRRARQASSRRSASTPRSSATATAPRSPSSSARSATSPRRIPSWCATCTAESAPEPSKQAMAPEEAVGEAWNTSRRCTTPTPATSAWSPGRLSS